MFGLTQEWLMLWVHIFLLGFASLYLMFASSNKTRDLLIIGGSWILLETIVALGISGD
jgi:hypothetical protein